ncbi:MAG: glycine cleavage system protein H, partial [Leptolyngbya sp. RL_3_1]|nr:glycine cleavage system protein H [Leptolyngbya sp. RL_3_1]
MALEYPENLQYLDTHEYARLDEDEEIVTVGLSAFAIDQLGGHCF